MKKLIMIVALIASMNVVMAKTENQQNTALAMPPHIEFRDWGVYAVAEYDFFKTMSWTFSEADVPPTISIDMPQFNAFTGVLGFQLRKETGLGIGFSYLKDANDAFTQMPVFVELRSHYLRSRLTPFSVVKVGYTFPLGRFQSLGSGNESLYVDHGGVMMGVQLGARFAFKRTFGMSINLGYTLLHDNNVVYNDAFYVQKSSQSVLFHNLQAGIALNF